MPTINFYPLTDRSANFAPPPQPAVKHVEDWWRSQPKYMDNEKELFNGSYKATVKKCQGIFDAMTLGYLMFCPVDIFIDATNDDKITWQLPASFMNERENLSIISMHVREQTSHMPIDHEIWCSDLFRIHPNWIASTEEGYSCLVVPPMHNSILPIQAVPGVIDTDTFVSDGHFSFMVKKGFKGIIKQGTPIAQVIPFKRETWEAEAKDFNGEMLQAQRDDVRSTFENGYRMKMWQKKVYR